MKLRELLNFAIKSRAVELHLAVNGPIELHVAGKVQQVNLPPLHAKDFEEMVVSKLSALARSTLRTTGRCEEPIEVEDIGQVHIAVDAKKARIILPVATSPAKSYSKSVVSDHSPGAVPTLAERLSHLFGRK